MDIFIIWNMNADSWNGHMTFMTACTTVEKAEDWLLNNPGPQKLVETPEVFKDRFVRYYTYFAIEKRTID